MADALVHLMICDLGGTRFAVEAESVVDVIDAEGEGSTREEDPDEEEEKEVDLAEVFGMPSPADGRILRLMGPAGTWRLKIGERATISSVEQSSVRPLPPFLGGLARSHALRGLLVHNERLALLLDETALGEWGE